MARNVHVARWACCIAAALYSVPASAFEMGWFGMGLRLGYSRLSLNADRTPLLGDTIRESVNDTNETIAAYNAAQGTSVPGYRIGDLGLYANMFEITPSLHLGGDGYFMKLELPIGISADVKTIGLGVYPINYGISYMDGRLFPYASGGFVLAYAFSNQYTPSGGSRIDVSAKGAVVQGRLALGLKYFLAEEWPVSIELGWAPYALGVVVDGNRPTTPDGQLPEHPGATARGGAGRVFDVRVGVDWF